MSFRRRLDWNSLRDSGPARLGPAFVTAEGRFNLSTIMRIATAKARRTRANVGGRLSWQACMRLELRQVWADAKRQRASLAPRPIIAPVAGRAAPDFAFAVAARSGREPSLLLLNLSSPPR